MSTKKHDFKKSTLGLLVLTVTIAILCLLCIFSNRLFYTPKAYADSTINKGITYINEMFKMSRSKTQKAINSMPEYDNATYTVEFHIDKRFAYENNFPYFDNLTASAFAFTDMQDGTTYNSIRLANSDDILFNINAAVKSGKTILSIPELVNGYYLTDSDPGLSIDDNDNEISIDDESDDEYDDNEEYYDVYDLLGYDTSLGDDDPSLFSYILRYSSLDPDSFGNLSTVLLSDLFESLPADCYLVSFGLADKSDVTVSVTEPELAAAIAYVIDKNISNLDFKQMFVSSFPNTEYETFIKNFVKGFKKIDCDSQNIYTINFKTNFFGHLKELTFSYIYENDFKSLTISLHKNRILVTMNDNNKFQEEIQEYDTKTLEVIYGVSPDKSVKGYIQYIEDAGAVLIYFDGIKFNNGFLDGNMSIIKSDTEQLSIDFSSSDKSILASYKREGETLAYLNINRNECIAPPFNWADLTSGKKYSDMTDYVNDVLSSEKVPELEESLQLEQFDAWLKPYYEKAAK